MADRIKLSLLWLGGMIWVTVIGTLLLLVGGTFLVLSKILTWVFRLALKNFKDEDFQA